MVKSEGEGHVIPILQTTTFSTIKVPVGVVTGLVVVVAPSFSLTHDALLPGCDTYQVFTFLV